MIQIRNVIVILIILGSATLQSATPTKQLVNYSDAPLSFEANQGQSGTETRFVARTSGYVLHLTDSGAVVAFDAGETVGMQLSGARVAHAAGVSRLEGVANYLLGRDPSKWLTHVPTYAKVEYREVYPGIGLTYYGNHGQLEYDFLVAPGANPGDIRLRFSNAKGLRINRQGDLVILTRQGKLILRRPVVYQQSGKGRTTVDGGFRLLASNAVRFQLGAYDHTKELVIDPTLSYSTYVGGPKGGMGGSELQAFVAGIAVDPAGSAYITGSTAATDYPATGGAFQTGVFTGKAGRAVAYVTKMNPNGTGLVYSTYLGGSGIDFGTGIAIDSAGHAFIGGDTNSTDFPTTPGSFQPQLTKGSNSGFIAELSADGTSLVYSTFLSAPGSDANISGIGLDGAGEVIATGATATFPAFKFPTTPGAYLTTPPGGFRTTNVLFVAKLNAPGSALVYSTLLCGNGVDVSAGIAADSQGNAYITGTSNSGNFPVTTGAYQTTRPSPGAFVTKLSPQGSSLVYSTFFGEDDNPTAIAIDDKGSAYVVGNSQTTGVPIIPTTSGAYLSKGHGAYLAKFSPDGSTLVYASFIGGGTYGSGVAVDSSGNSYVSGYLGGNGLAATTDAYQKSTPNTSTFVFEMNPAGTAPVYATYFGANLGAYTSANPIFVVGVDSNGGIYLSGAVYGGVPTTTDGYQTKHSQASFDGFVAKFGPSASATPIVSAVVNAASSQPGIVPGAYATIYGSNLSPVTDTWANSIVDGKLPTSLDQVSVSVSGQAAYVYYISPGQINFVVPNVGTGSKQLVVTQPAGSSAPYTTNSSTYGPAFFLLPGNQPVATHQDYTLAVKDGTYAGVTTVPAKPGEIIILWGTSFGPTTPTVPEGMETPSDTTYSTATLPSVNISNAPATVYGAALAPGFAGLYQVAVKVPESLADGDWPVVAMIGGVSSEAGVMLTVQK